MTYKAIKTKLYLNENEKKFLLYLMHEAKDLYNQALYNVWQHYFETGKYLSYLDNDDFKKQAFLGKRIKRGLYKSEKGILINADLNASLNIIRKSKPNALGTGFKGCNTPKRTYLLG